MSLFMPGWHVPAQYQRQVYVTNVLSFIFCWAAVGVFFIFYYLFGWMATLPYILLVALLFLVITPINRANYHVGRIMLCLIPVWLVIFITIFFKLEQSDAVRTTIPYFDSRFILMASPILPGIVFRLHERIALFICLASVSICLIFFDPIHQIFGVGYFQRGFTDVSYYYINYIVIIAFVVLVFGILLLRSMLERSEKNLLTQNSELHNKQNEIEAQHEELLQQQEEVVSSSEKLEQANKLILEQQRALERYNAKLETIVEERGRNLLHANEELVKHNNELLQFSYSVSHNLRGPVARLLGLTRIAKYEDRPEESERLRTLIENSSRELDEVLRDLSLIIDIRNDLYRIRERVSLEHELERALHLLEDYKNVIDNFEVNFQVSHIFGVRPMVQSVFYNLMSNAIKYRSAERPLHVHVSSFALPGRRTIVEVKDNGIGIDLAHHRDDIFKLYKRFHPHVGGKGLGLYLVKTQTETMGGTITVESEPGVGSTFTLTFAEPEQVDRQIFHDSEAAQLYYDGDLKSTGIVWKRSVTSAEYRETLMLALRSLKTYDTPGWIVDLRKRQMIQDEDKKWFAETFAPEATIEGLKYVSLITLPEFDGSEYFLHLGKVCSLLGIELKTHSTLNDARMWLKKTI
jgi:signal transduction histidine kinase